MSKIRAHFTAIVTLFLVCACASSGYLTPADVADLELTNPQIVGGSVITGGQPTENDLERLRQSGVTTVVSMRRSDEDTGFDERAKVESLGMTYVSLPVSMSDGLDVDTAIQLRSILGESDGPAFVHCGSGNRVGGIYAIGAHQIDGVSLEEALAIGRTAGLTGLEPRIREILEAAEAEAGS